MSSKDSGAKFKVGDIVYLEASFLGERHKCVVTSAFGDRYYVSKLDLPQSGGLAYAWQLILVVPEWVDQSKLGKLL